jgi:hypothetical protein
MFASARRRAAPGPTQIALRFLFVLAARAIAALRSAFLADLLVGFASGLISPSALPTGSTTYSSADWIVLVAAAFTALATLLIALSLASTGKSPFERTRQLH